MYILLGVVIGIMISNTVCYILKSRRKYDGKILVDETDNSMYVLMDDPEGIHKKELWLRRVSSK